MKKINEYDVLIVGAGPAALFAALKLSEEPDIKVVILDKGPSFSRRYCPADVGGLCPGCGNCDVLSGIGGASTMFGGKICNFPAGSGLKEVISETNLNSSSEVFNFRSDELNKLANEFIIEQNVGPYIDEQLDTDVRFKFYEANVVPQKSMRRKFETIINYLSTKIEIRPNSEIVDVSVDDSGKFRLKVIVSGRESTLKSDHLVLSVGRSGVDFLNRISSKLELQIIPNSVDLGVRIEMPIKILEGLKEITEDPKIKMNEYEQNEVRTFCACIGGKVTILQYSGVYSVDGHFGNELTSNANVAVMNRRLPPANITGNDYAMEYARNLNIDGKPIVQKLNDFMGSNHSVRYKNQPPFTPTLTDVREGEINKRLSPEIYEILVQGILKLDDFIPGIANSANLVFAPAIDRFWDRFILDQNFMSNIPNLYVIGDAAGYARGILQAAWSGALFGNSFLKRVENIPHPSFSDNFVNNIV